MNQSWEGKNSRKKVFRCVFEPIFFISFSVTRFESLKYSYIGLGSFSKQKNTCRIHKIAPKSFIETLQKVNVVNEKQTSLKNEQKRHTKIWWCDDRKWWTKRICHHHLKDINIFAFFYTVRFTLLCSTFKRHSSKIPIVWIGTDEG